MDCRLVSNYSEIIPSVRKIFDLNVSGLYHFSFQLFRDYPLGKGVPMTLRSGREQILPSFQLFRDYPLGKV